MAMKKYTPISVIWVDTETMDDWFPESDLKKWDSSECLCHSVGLFLKKTKNHLLLSGISLDRDEACACIQKIPLGCVKKIRRLYDKKRSHKSSVRKSNK